MTEERRLRKNAKERERKARLRLDPEWRAKDNARKKKYRSTPHGKEYSKEYRKKWRALHPDYQKEWVASHRETMRKSWAKWYEKNKDAERLRKKQWREQHRDHERERHARWSEEHPNYRRAVYAKIKMLCMIDAQYYAKYRAGERLRSALRTVRRGKVYRPILSKRIPDYCVMGGVLDFGSQFLPENLTPAQRAYARDCLQRRAIWKKIRRK